MRQVIPCGRSGSVGCGTLERLGLAEASRSSALGSGGDTEQRLRALGERGDIIKRLHKTLAKDGAARAPSSWALEGKSHGEPIVGRLMARGLDDELRGTAFAVVDEIDGRVHHLKLPDIDLAGDGPIGGIVELRRFEDTKGRQRIALAVRSDLNLDQQVVAEGATWLDRRLVTREPPNYRGPVSAPRSGPRWIGGSMLWRGRGSPPVMEIRSHWDAT